MSVPEYLHFSSHTQSKRLPRWGKKKEELKSSGSDSSPPYHNPRQPQFTNISSDSAPHWPTYGVFGHQCPIWMRRRLIPFWMHREYPSIEYTPWSLGWQPTWTITTVWCDLGYPLIDGPNVTARDGVGGASSLILFFYTEIAKVRCANAEYNVKFCDAFDIDCQVAKEYPVCRPYILRHGRRKNNNPFADITRERYMEHILAIIPQTENFPYEDWDVIPPCPECPIPGNYLLVSDWHQTVKELVPGKTESKYWWTRWCKYNSIDLLDLKPSATAGFKNE